MQRSTQGLLSAYAADRADDASANLSALAIISAGLVYVGAASLFLLPRCPGQVCDPSEVPLLALLLLPLPAVSLSP